MLPHLEGAGLGLFIHPPPVVTGCGFLPGALDSLACLVYVVHVQACHKGQEKLWGTNMQALRIAGEAVSQGDMGDTLTASVKLAKNHRYISACSTTGQETRKVDVSFPGPRSPL